MSVGIWKAATELIMELSATEQREVPDPRAATHLETGNTAICNLCLSITFLLPSCQLLILSQHSQEQRPTGSDVALGTNWSSHKHIEGTSVESCLCAHTALFTSPKHAAGSAVTHLHLHLQDTSHFQVPSGVWEEGKALFWLTPAWPQHNLLVGSRATLLRNGSRIRGT